MSVHEHRSSAVLADVRCAVITCSDTRTIENDTSGDLIEEMAREAGFKVVSRQVVEEDPPAIKLALEAARIHANVVIMTGGTGIAPRDRTPDVVETYLDRTLPGFGELFRMLSFEEIGPSAFLSRAFAGTHGETVIFALPGSTAAVRLAMERLIVPELRHIVALLER